MQVFADHCSSQNPIDVPRSWIWDLPRRTVYFGTSVPTIFRGSFFLSNMHGSCTFVLKRGETGPLQATTLILLGKQRGLGTENTVTWHRKIAT
jgi:hypothetical protein